MNCINHPSEAAVSQCQHCGKGLCIECTNRFSKPICPECISASRKKQKGAVVIEILLTFLIGLPVGIILGLLVNDSYKTPDNLWESHFFLIYMGLLISAEKYTSSSVQKYTIFFK